MPKTRKFENWRRRESLKKSEVTQLEEEVDVQDLQDFCNVYMEEVQKVIEHYDGLLDNCKEELVKLRD